MNSRYEHIRDNKAYGTIRELLAKGINQTSIAWHLNNRRPLVPPPYGAKEWTALLVNNVLNCHEEKPAGI
jgi:hypothetical protein